MGRVSAQSPRSSVICLPRSQAQAASISGLAALSASAMAWAASAVLYALAYVPTMWSLESPSAGLDPVLPLAALFLGLALGLIDRRIRGGIDHEPRTAAIEMSLELSRPAQVALLATQ